MSETLSNFSLGTGPDQVPGNVFQAVSDNLSVHLLKLVQNIISTCDYPECWKLIGVKPIHKKGSTKNIENYRPVASLSKLSLCFETLLFLETFLFQPSPGPPILKKEYMMPTTVLSISKDVSQSLCQVNKNLLPTKHTLKHS